MTFSACRFGLRYIRLSGSSVHKVIDLHIVISERMEQWMIDMGADQRLDSDRTRHDQGW